MDILKVVLIAIIVSILALFLKSVRSEYSILVVIIGSVILIVYILNSLSGIFSFFSKIIDRTGIDKDLFMVVFKIIGVGYLVEFSASVCADSGNSSIANKVLLAGKILIFILSMPIITNLFEIVVELI